MRNRLASFAHIFDPAAGRTKTIARALTGLTTKGTFGTAIQAAADSESASGSCMSRMAIVELDDDGCCRTPAINKPDSSLA